MSGSTIPIVLTAAGAQPQSPAALQAQLIALVTTGVDPYGNTITNPNPGYTATLPGSLIDDVVGTDVGALALIDQARVETLNSITPYGANSYVLAQLGAAKGLPIGQPTNATVDVLFTGPAGYVLPIGFLVSDGSNQYALNDGGIIATGGVSPQLTATCTNPNTFAIPANSVNQLASSVPTGITLTVTNPNAGTPAQIAETATAYRARVLEAEQITVQGSPQILKAALKAIIGVVPQQVSVRSVSPGWEVICGGGDAYLIADAIYRTMPNIAEVVGSTMLISTITQANPGVVGTVLNHGYANGQVVTFSGVGGMTALNTGSYTVTVIDQQHFSIGVNTTGYGAYTSGGQVLPNLRNVTVSISDYPDTYAVTFVVPPQQIVNVQLTWNTDAPNFVAVTSIAQLGQPAIVNYINSIPVGQPINLFVLYSVFQTAIASILNINFLTRLVATVEINSIAVSPASGTGLIAGDPESYFFASAATVSVTQG